MIQFLSKRDINPFPENDILEIDEQKYDLTGLKRHAQLMFGRPIPKKKPEKSS